jgi:hypothetical protein
MANTQSQFGFKHIGYISGGAPDYQQSTRVIQASYSTQIGFGDPVTKLNATSPWIVQAANTISTTNILEGIFVGCNYIPSGGGAPVWSPFYPGSVGGTAATAYIIDAPTALFLVAALNTSITSANIGQSINFTTGVPNTTGGGFAIATIDQATATSQNATSAALPFKIYSLFNGVGNGSDPTTAYGWAIVTFNNERWKTLTAL